MSENLKKFLDLLGSDKELEAKALACNEQGEEKGREAMLALAKECGIELTAADFENPAETASHELDDNELDAVAGGSGACYCLVGGGGGGKYDGSGTVYGCACVAYGQGGNGKDNDMSCICTGYGAGDANGGLLSAMF